MATRSALKNPSTRRRLAGGMADQIDNLAAGVSIASAERFPIKGNDQIDRMVLDSLKRQRSLFGTYVARITDELDSRQFKIESGAYLSDDKTSILATAVVTRLS